MTSKTLTPDLHGVNADFFKETAALDDILKRFNNNITLGEKMYAYASAIKRSLKKKDYDPTKNSGSTEPPSEEQPPQKEKKKKTPLPYILTGGLILGMGIGQLISSYTNNIHNFATKPELNPNQGIVMQVEAPTPSMPDNILPQPKDSGSKLEQIANETGAQTPKTLARTAPAKQDAAPLYKGDKVEILRTGSVQKQDNNLYTVTLDFKKYAPGQKVTLSVGTDKIKYDRVIKSGIINEKGEAVFKDVPFFNPHHKKSYVLMKELGKPNNRVGSWPSVPLTEQSEAMLASHFENYKRDVLEAETQKVAAAKPEKKAPAARSLTSEMKQATPITPLVVSAPKKQPSADTTLRMSKPLEKLVVAANDSFKEFLDIQGVGSLEKGDTVISGEVRKKTSPFSFAYDKDGNGKITNDEYIPTHINGKKFTVSLPYALTKNPNHDIRIVFGAKGQETQIIGNIGELLEDLKDYSRERTHKLMQESTYIPQKPISHLKDKGLMADKYTSDIKETIQDITSSTGNYLTDMISALSRRSEKLGIWFEEKGTSLAYELDKAADKALDAILDIPNSKPVQNTTSFLGELYTRALNQIRT